MTDSHSCERKWWLQLEGVRLLRTVENVLISVGELFTDKGKAFYIDRENKMFLNLHATRSKSVFVEEDGEYYNFRFDGRQESAFKRKDEL